MGKKKKNDYWGVSEENQMQFVESIEDLTNTKTPDFFKNAAKPNPNKVDSIDDLISSAIQSRDDSSEVSDDHDAYWGNDNDDNASYHDDQSNSDAADVLNDHDAYWGNDTVGDVVDSDFNSIIASGTLYDKPAPPSFDNGEETYLRRVKFINKFINTLGKATFTDGIASTTFDVNNSRNQYLDVPVPKIDDSMEILLFIYALSLKHPSAILTIYEYINALGNVVEYNETRFKFISIDDDDELISCYIIDDDSLKEFYSYVETLSADDRIRLFITLGYAVGQLNEAFFGDDPDYVNMFINTPTLNAKEAFLSYFMADPGTETGEVGDDDDMKIKLYRSSEIQSLARQSIMHLVGDDEDDEDEDDESDEDTSEEDNSEDTVDAKTGEELTQVANEDAVDLLTPEMTMMNIDNAPSPSIQKVNTPVPKATNPAPAPVSKPAASDDDDSLVVSVVRK